MDEQVTVSIQLPAGALGQLAQALSAARELLAGRGTAASSEGAVASGSFDEARFRELALRQEAGAVSSEAAPPEAEGVWAAEFGGVQAPEAAEVLPAAEHLPAASLRAEQMGPVPEASTAAGEVTSPLSPPLPQRGGIREELVQEGPAPLTAEAVSLAFRRDDRRYDRGFPLY